MVRKPGDYYQLRDVKRHDPLALLWQATSKLGPAAQTLGAVRRKARRSGTTFARVSLIARLACRSQRSVERDLDLLVKNRWLIDHGRQGRRTTTYEVVGNLLNGQGDLHKFGILPRWAATMLPTWAERVVFAAVVSRDALCEYIAGVDGEEGEDVHGRLKYPGRELREHTGLSLRSIATAKASLVARGLIIIDSSVPYPDERGRLSTMADFIHMNPDFRVPAALVDRSANLAGTLCKSGGCPSANLAGTWCKSGGCSDSHLLSHPSKSIKRSTASPPAASPLGVYKAHGEVA